MKTIIVFTVISLLLMACRHRGDDETATSTPARSEASEMPSSAPSVTDAPAETGSPAPTNGVQPTLPGAASSGCGSAHATGSSVDSLEADGLTRSYRLYVPTSYDGSQVVALVLNFHGYGSTALEQETYSEFPDKAESAGFITVAPEGTGSPQEWWLAGQILPGYVDDFSFTRQLIARLESQLCIDTSRVYATGISNGAAFASLAACKLSDVIAAVAPVAAEPWSSIYCAGKSPVPIIALHGTDDALVPFEGGSSLRGLPVKPARENLQSWGEFNGCDPTLQSERIASDVLRESYANCENKADAVLYVIEGGGHTWPGAHFVPGLGNVTSSIDATDLAWEFFEVHTLR